MSNDASLSVMGDRSRDARSFSSGKERPDWVGLWVLLGLGAFLMLAAALAGADEAGFTAERTDHFNATLPPGSTLGIENMSGDVVGVPVGIFPPS